jgi:hypothetical protein
MTTMTESRSPLPSASIDLTVPLPDDDTMAVAITAWLAQTVESTDGPTTLALRIFDGAADHWGALTFHSPFGSYHGSLGTLLMAACVGEHPDGEDEWQIAPLFTVPAGCTVDFTETGFLGDFEGVQYQLQLLRPFHVILASDTVNYDETKFGPAESAGATAAVGMLLAAAEEYRGLVEVYQQLAWTGAD